jgi:exopolyphosphatase
VDPSKQYVPLLNFRKSHVLSRKDVMLVLAQFNIDKDSLFFIDDLQQLKPQGVVLVDHNRPTSPLTDYKVCGIIDHHDDEHLFPEVSPRIVQRAGSCSTLIADYWLQQGVSLDNELVKFLLAPLTMDTRNLTARMEPIDVEIAKKYQEFISPTEITSWFTELQESKLDISGLSGHEVLAKDYKLFEFGVGTEEVPKKIGISAIVKPYSWLKSEYNFQEELAKYLKDQQLDVLLFMTAFEQGQFQRELGYVVKDEGNELIMDLAFVSSLIEELQLELIEGKVFKQNNVAASRKQVAPALKSALERL